MSEKNHKSDDDALTLSIVTEVRREEALLKAGALQSAIFNSANFSSIATDAKGVIIGYLLIGTDNTARKQVEAEQKKLDQRLRDQQFYTRSLIESHIDALVITDPLGIITDANKQMEALTGCTRDELIGAPFKNYFTDPERAEESIKLALREKRVTDYVRARP